MRRQWAVHLLTLHGQGALLCGELEDLIISSIHTGAINVTNFTLQHTLAAVRCSGAHILTETLGHVKSSCWVIMHYIQPQGQDGIALCVGTSQHQATISQDLACFDCLSPTTDFQGANFVS